MCSVVQLYTTVATQTIHTIIHTIHCIYSGWCISSGSSAECESLRTKGARWTPSCVRIAGHQLLSLRLSFHTRCSSSSWSSSWCGRWSSPWSTWRVSTGCTTLMMSDNVKSYFSIKMRTRIKDQDNLLPRPFNVQPQACKLEMYGVQDPGSQSK